MWILDRRGIDGRITGRHSINERGLPKFLAVFLHLKIAGLADTDGECAYDGLHPVVGDEER